MAGAYLFPESVAQPKVSQPAAVDCLARDMNNKQADGNARMVSSLAERALRESGQT